jgi:membrane fusion protein, protease secretion system
MNLLSKSAEQADDVADKKKIHRDTRGPIRLGLWSLLIGLGGFVLWAVLAPLDEGVPTAATVAIDTKRKSVQHPTGGVVKEVLVKEGQLVKEGELLMRLNDANAVAVYEASRHQYLSLRAVQARLVAEKNGESTPKFHADLVKAASDPLIANHMRNQQELFRSRRDSLASEMQAMNENLAGLKAQLQGAKDVVVQKGAQLNLLSYELDKSRDLIDQGYMTRQRGWDLERQIAEITGARADLTATIEKLSRSVQETLQRMRLRQHEYAKEVETQLTEVIRSVDSEEKRFDAVKADLARTEVRSPVEGQVLGLMNQTVGGVIQGGQKIMDVVPEDDHLILEAKILPHLIDKVRSDDPVDIRFTAFAHSPQLVVSGKILSISKDLLNDPPPSLTPTYYLARVVVTPEGMKKLGNRQLQAGMPAEVVIKTGERSLMTYLLHPLVKRIAASMKEE